MLQTTSEPFTRVRPFIVLLLPHILYFFLLLFVSFFFSIFCRIVCIVVEQFCTHTLSSEI